MPACQSIGSFDTIFPVLILYPKSANLLAALSALESLKYLGSWGGGSDTLGPCSSL